VSLMFLGMFILWCLTPFSTIFQLYRGSQLYWGNKSIIKGRQLQCKSHLNFNKLMNIVFARPNIIVIYQSINGGFLDQ
jgi:hypothetical protein